MADEGKFWNDEMPFVVGLEEPDEVSVIIKNFFPNPSAFAGWQTGFQRTYKERGRRLERTVLNDPEDPERRVLIDACESKSSAQAKMFVEGVLKNNALPPSSFKWGKRNSLIIISDLTNPSASGFEILGNLALHLTSFGRADVDVSTIADRINTSLSVDFPGPPHAERIKIPQLLAYLRRKLRVKYVVPPLSPEGGFVKFVATGGELRLKGTDTLIYKYKTGKAAVHAFSIGPTGEPSPVSIRLES